METSQRLHVVDALRGFAIVSIMLLHNIEHFDFYYFPQNLPEWMKLLDGKTWEIMFFLFGGKSYAIFSLLFGLTFFIQDNNQQKKGKDFRGRFAWRLLLLLGFGLINSAFYEGDILTFYALVGFALIPVARLNTKTVLIIASILMLQPYEWYNFFFGLQHPEIAVSNPESWAYFGRAGEYIPGDSLLKTMYGNLTNGKTGVFIWCWEEGRVFQTAALFMLGMVAGRMNLFSQSKGNMKFWFITLLVAVLSFVLLYYLKLNIAEWIQAGAVQRPLLRIVTSVSNVSFMFVLVSSFVLLFFTVASKVLHIFSSLGKMSMSNYIMQSILGSFIYYGFGLGLYQYTGASYSMLIGVALAVFQGVFSSWWMKNHKQGPLESIWHKLTWIGGK